MTDGIKATVDNTARMFGGTVIESRYAYVVGIYREETRTADEVINQIRSGLNELRDK